MARKSKSVHEKSVLRYPAGKLSPTDFLRFIQMDPFVEDWKRLKMDDDDLRALEILIMIDPTRFPVIPGTGGLRKLRFASSRWNRGKSSGARVCYAYFPVSSVAVLFTAFGKGEQEDLSAEERRIIKKELSWIENALAKGM